MAVRTGLWGWQSQGEVTAAIRKSWFCWDVGVSEMHKGLITADRFLPACLLERMDNLGLTFSATLHSPNHQTLSTLSHSLPRVQAFLRAQADDSVPK